MLLEFVFGAIVGVTLGLMGGGGSALAVPLLAYGLGLEARQAIATSLVVVGLAAAAGALRHWRQGTVDLRIALIFGIFGSVGSAGGAQLARFLLPSVQMTLFAVAMIVAAFLMLRRQSSQDTAPAAPSRHIVQAILAALATGVLTGLVGIGGGFAVVPALVFLTDMPMHRAIGTSLLVITFNALGGIASYASYTTLAPSIIVPFAGAAILGVVIATILGREMAELKLRNVFAGGLLVIGIFTIAREGLTLWY